LSLIHARLVDWFVDRMTLIRPDLVACRGSPKAA
jgi:hypothetical protein